MAAAASPAESVIGPFVAPARDSIESAGVRVESGWWPKTRAQQGACQVKSRTGGQERIEMFGIGALPLHE